jgi:hypothetical protein
MKRILAMFTGLTLMTVNATQGLINGPFILGALLLMGAATMHHLLNTEKQP